MVDVAAAVLLHLGTVTDDGSVDERWLAALPRGRAEIHQATGMLIAQLGVPPAQALSLLRGRAFATGRRIEDVSRDVVARRLDFTEPNS